MMAVSRHVPLFACLAFVLLLCNASLALCQGTQVVYVDGLNGSNHNNGTASSPYQTLNYTIGVLCNNLNPTYTVVMAPAAIGFVYTEQIGFTDACATLDVTITSINPADEEAVAFAKSSHLLNVPMAQIAWTAASQGATMSLTFDHIIFTGQMYLAFDPDLDLGSTAMYSLTMQNCVFNNTIGYNVPIDISTNGDIGLKSPIEFRLADSMVLNSNLGVSFIYTAGATPTYVYVTNTQFQNNIANGPIFNGNSIMVLSFDGCEFRDNNSPQYQLIATQGDFQQAGAGPLPPAFNFTNNIVDGNTFAVLIAVQNRRGAYLVDHNKITNNQFAKLDYNSDATSYFTGDNGQSPSVLPFVISNNVFSCNQGNGTNLAFFVRNVNAYTTDPWILSNNVNGDPTNCPIPALPGAELVDGVNTQSCLPGYYNNLSTGSPNHCVACAAGSYNSNYGASSCTACTPGTFASGLASQACTPCPAGTHARTSGASVCDNCNSGFFASQPGEIVCEKCASGTCTPTSGAWTSCQQAPCSSAAKAPISLE